MKCLAKIIVLIHLFNIIFTVTFKRYNNMNEIGAKADAGDTLKSTIII